MKKAGAAPKPLWVIKTQPGLRGPARHEWRGMGLVVSNTRNLTIRSRFLGAARSTTLIGSLSAMPKVTIQWPISLGPRTMCTRLSTFLTHRMAVI